MLHTLVPDLNIAPLKYAHVHKDHGGPVEAVEARELPFLGRALFHASARLDPARSNCRVAEFSGSQGSHGAGTSRPEAIFSAISEGMRVWAWLSALADPALKGTLALDHDPSLTGFAAFPGLGRQGARKRAYFAAAEKWSLREWWEGRLPHRRLALDALSKLYPEIQSVQAIQIQSSTPGAAIALLWKEDHGLSTYGAAAAHSGFAAAEQALLRLELNGALLAGLRSPAPERRAPGLAEHRLQFFAEGTGRDIFHERLSRQGRAGPAPALLVDQPALGPWVEYAHVWRCLFDGSHFRDNENYDYFFF